MKRLILLLLICAPMLSFSQENTEHEYLSIIHSGYEMTINQDSDSYELVNVKKEMDSRFDQRPVLKRMENLESEGWTLVTYNSKADAGFLFVSVLMRRKKD